MNLPPVTFGKKTTVPQIYAAIRNQPGIDTDTLEQQTVGKQPSVSELQKLYYILARLGEKEMISTQADGTSGPVRLTVNA